jgi:hypothetical protein
VAYERLVNWVAPLAGLRACLFGCFRKDGTPDRAPMRAETYPASGERPAGPEQIRPRVPENAC